MIDCSIYLLFRTMVAIFPYVCLWRYSYAQNWEVLTLKNCYSIEPPSYASTAYVVASFGLVSKKLPVRLWTYGVRVLQVTVQGIPVFKGMITSSLFTPVPFYCWKSKMIFGASVISMDIAISR